MGITVEVYDDANSVLVDALLEKSRDRRWQDPLSQPGGAVITLANTDPNRANMTQGNVLRFVIDGVTCFAAEVGPSEVRRVDGGEEAQQVTVYTCPGTMNRWHEFVVYPEFPLGVVPDVDERHFNFASSYLDDSGWSAAVEGEQGTGDLGGPRYGLPKNLPPQVEAAYWIWDSAVDINGSHAAGDVYFRKAFTTSGGLFRIFVTADNAHELWLDDRKLEEDRLDQAGGVGWAGFKTIDRWLTPGDHLIAAKATNAPGTDPNPAGLLFALVELLDQGSTLGNAVVVSDSSWLALGYPSEPPGFTPYDVLSILLTEAQTRGCVPELTLGGSSTQDADGTNWPSQPDISFRCGISGLDVLKQLAETLIDCAMDPESMRLDIWIRGAKGTASGVTLTEGGNLLAALHSVGISEASTSLNRWSGGWTESTDGTLEAIRRREVFLSAGSASPEEANRNALANITRLGYATPKVALAWRPVAGDVPYVDVVLGDTLIGPDADGNPVTWRVMAWSVTEHKENDVVDYVPELVFVP